MHLKDIPKYVSVKVGDTVVTDGKSSIFPKGIMIGRVAGYDVDSKTGHWDISVELSQNMGQVQKVFVVKNLKKVELEEIKEILDAAVKENDQQKYFDGYFIHCNISNITSFFVEQNTHHGQVSANFVSYLCDVLSFLQG